MDLPFQCETILEERICADVAWQQGVVWGEPRPGHSEGQVMYHIAEVLTNIDRLARTHEERRDLRLITLIMIPSNIVLIQPNLVLVTTIMQCSLANLRSAISTTLLFLISWNCMMNDSMPGVWRTYQSRWNEAEARTQRLVARLGSSLPLYVLFFRADNRTGSKKPDSLIRLNSSYKGKG